MLLAQYGCVSILVYVSQHCFLLAIFDIALKDDFSGWRAFVANAKNICDGLLLGLGWRGTDYDFRLIFFFEDLFFASDTFEHLPADGATTLIAVATNFFISGSLWAVQRTGWVSFPNLHHSGLTGQGGSAWTVHLNGPATAVLEVLLFLSAVVKFSWSWLATLFFDSFSTVVLVRKGATSGLVQSTRE